MGRGDDRAHWLLLESAGKEHLAQQRGGPLTWVVRAADRLSAAVAADHPREGPGEEHDGDDRGDRSDDGNASLHG